MFSTFLEIGASSRLEVGWCRQHALGKNQGRPRHKTFTKPRRIAGADV
jgi:hypothetical protein